MKNGFNPCWIKTIIRWHLEVVAKCSDVAPSDVCLCIGYSSENQHLFGTKNLLRPQPFWGRFLWKAWAASLIINTFAVHKKGRAVQFDQKKSPTFP